MDYAIPKKLTLINAFLIGMVMLLAFFYIRDTQLLVDETTHLHQIEQFISGDFRLDPMISILPGYHFVVAGIAYLTGGGGYCNNHGDLAGRPRRAGHVRIDNNRYMAQQLLAADCALDK
jgi:hypothetical protein